MKGERNNKPNFVALRQGHQPCLIKSPDERNKITLGFVAFRRGNSLKSRPLWVEKF